MRQILLPCLFYLFIFILPATLQAKEQTPKADQFFSYGQYLYSQKEYYRAITAFKQYLFYSPSDLKKPQARLMIGKSYLAGAETDAAITYLTAQTTQSPGYAPYWTYLGIAHLDHHIKAPYTLREKDINQALAAFSHVSLNTPQGVYLQDFVDQFKNTDQTPTYSPLLAGSLSAILPGAGSLYTGRVIEASYAFLITSLFLSAAYQTRKAGQPGLAVVFATFGLSFYGGNIYVAVNSAFKRNDQIRSTQLRQLRQKHGLYFQPHHINPRF